MPEPLLIAYGPDPIQAGDLYLPPGDQPVPVVVLLHGGNWAAVYDRVQLAGLANDLVRHGWAVWNVDYRSLGGGGGWTATFDDVATAVDALAGLDDRLDLTRVTVVGHSAGGQLALWSAARPLLPAEAPGSAPVVAPVGAVSLGGVIDLVAADAARYGASMADPNPTPRPGGPRLAHPELSGAVAELAGEGVVAALLGGHSADVPQRYTWMSPTSTVPTVPTLAVHGVDDDIVTADFSRAYHRAALAKGVPAELHEVRGDHFDVVHPGDPSWAAVLEWLDALR
ncbi:MAG TPA: alpha/beta hydrolase [Pseudonocardiaceae bacterium]|jgi:acetyl esterase/lipase|nr:alpha/beta hydrolase [Pseudonocardiaceae bacterium]